MLVCLQTASSVVGSPLDFGELRTPVVVAVSVARYSLSNLSQGERFVVGAREPDTTVLERDAPRLHRLVSRGAATIGGRVGP